MARAATAKYPKPVAKLNDMISTITKVKGSAKGITDLDGVTRNTTALLMVSPELIRPIKGFNPRIHEAKDAGTGKSYAEELEELKNSIQTEGFFLDKPISGYPGMEDGENVVYIIDGHRRMEAVQALLDEGVEIASVPVVLSPANTDPIKLVIQNVKKNLNRRFTFFETSFQVARLLGIGKSKADIVELMGLTEVAVQDCLDFIEIVPKPIREHVKLGRISGTEALRICRQSAYKNNPDKAIAKVQEMIEKAESEGRTKASRKDDPDSEPVKSLTGRGRGRPRGKAGSRDEPEDERDDGITEDMQWTKFPEPRPMPGRKLLSPVRFLASEGDEFSIADIRNFKNLFGDLEWFRLDEDRPQIGIALVDVEFVAYMVVPADALETGVGPEDPEDDEEEPEEDEDEAEQEDEEGEAEEGERERAAASADL
jgi:ParB family transcriptional regulator, chromosome partitioning protein